MIRRRDFPLLGSFVVREVQGNIRGSNLGWIWLFVSPILLLLVYTLVFGFIFDARAPQDLDVPFIAWLSVALWPWLAFSDGILRASGGLVKHSAVLSKVPVPAILFPFSSHAAAFLLHLGGYVVILICLSLFGIKLTLAGLPYVFLLLLALYFFSLGLALVVATFQVWIRDVEVLLPTFLMLWFFLTPIIYAPELLPDAAQPWLALNPLTWWVGEIRAAVFEGKLLPDRLFFLLCLGSAAVLWSAVSVFQRLEPHFEDFL